MSQRFRTGSRWALAGLALALAPVLAEAQKITTSLGRVPKIGISLGRRSRTPVHENTSSRTRAWVREVLSRVLARTSLTRRDSVELHILEWDLVNAFATPDLKVYVTTGLLEQVRSDDELAAVLGHELGHIQARHGMGRSKQTMLWNALALAVGVTQGTRQAILGGQAMGMLARLRYGRKQELEADRLGMEYCNLSGYDSTALTDFFERIEALEGPMSDPVSSWLSTHPPARDRLAQARAFARENGVTPSAHRRLGQDLRESPLLLDLSRGFKGLEDSRVAAKQSGEPMFVSGSVPGSLVENSGFETGLDGARRIPCWTATRGRLVRDGAVFASGLASLRCEAPGGSREAGFKSLRIPLDRTADYIFSGYIKASSSQVRVSLGLRLLDEKGELVGERYPAALGVFPGTDFLRYSGLVCLSRERDPALERVRFVEVVGSAKLPSGSSAWFDDLALMDVREHRGKPREPVDKVTALRYIERPPVRAGSE